jgi:hypothetical protein
VRGAAVSPGASPSLASSGGRWRGRRGRRRSERRALMRREPYRIMPKRYWDLSNSAASQRAPGQRYSAAWRGRRREGGSCGRGRGCAASEGGGRRRRRREKPEVPRQPSPASSREGARGRALEGGRRGGSEVAFVTGGTRGRCCPPGKLPKNNTTGREMKAQRSMQEGVTSCN